VIRRDEFDHWLAKKAESRGIEIREGVTLDSNVNLPNCHLRPTVIILGTNTEKRIEDALKSENKNVKKDKGKSG